MVSEKKCNFVPVELRKAHKANDLAAMQAYGFNVKTMTESLCVAELFNLYQELTNNKEYGFSHN